MKKIVFLSTVLLMSLSMLAAPKPLRVLVLGDDPMMVSDPSNGAVGYADLLQTMVEEGVTVEVQASADVLPKDPAALLEPAQKGDVVLLCKRPVQEPVYESTPSDVYLNQLVPIQQAAKKKGVVLVWLTPVSPRYYTAEGKQVHRLGYYPEVIRRMCKRDLLPLIDVEQLTFDWLNEVGQEGSADAYVPVKAISAAHAEKTAREGELLTQVGAEKVVELIANALRLDKANVLNKRIRSAAAQVLESPVVEAPAEEAPAEESVAQ